VTSIHMVTGDYISTTQMDPSKWRCMCVDDKEGYNGLCAVICLM